MTWKVPFIRGSKERFWEGELVAEWSADLESISDNYDPIDTNASSLFDMWASQVRKKYTNGLVPISWTVSCREAAKFEFMPFQFNHFDWKENFLTFYGWPMHSKTGEPLDWLTLPVNDKRWETEGGVDKGGFIQAATGWKPSIFQAFVPLDALEKSKSGY